MELEVLVERFKKKDVEAFEKLHNMYAENVYGVINTIVRDRVLAQDICQDVFIKIWDNAESYNSSKGRFFTWVMNIARNAAIDKVRSKSHKNSKQNLSADYFVGILATEQQNVTKIDVDGLKRMVNNLKKKCIEIIEMLYFRGYTQKETAEELEIPVGTVKTRNRSCISQLRKNMKV